MNKSKKIDNSEILKILADYLNKIPKNEMMSGMELLHKYQDEKYKLIKNK